jgi:hypothetical protein
MTPTFHPGGSTGYLYDYTEVTIRLHEPVADPFRTVSVTGSFGRAGDPPLVVEGFCDSQDGSVHRIRFMPVAPGTHEYEITLRHGSDEWRFAGAFTADSADLPGLLRVDPEHPWHFQWSGTGEHFFWNATTAYHLAGCSDEEIEAAIHRLAKKKVNRIRVALSPARNVSAGRWYEPQVTIDEEFTFLYGPWLCARPESVEDPGWDVTRFDVAYWQKFERLLTRAFAHDMIVSVVMFLDGRDPQNYPFDRERQGDDPDERRYYAYAAARLAAFANVEWCVTNEWRHFRTDAWAEAMGTFLSERDPYGHLMSVHGHDEFPFRTSPWADFAMFQIWDEAGGYQTMLEKRREQAATGRPMPQVNEEYGYEDHYPAAWGGGRTKPARSADNRRRLAWEMTMAGCYQTTGESAENGLGGWVNGRGDASMTMLDGYAHLVDFFTAFDWWRLEPHPDQGTQPRHRFERLGDGGAICLAEPGRRYIFYLPEGGNVTTGRTAVSGNVASGVPSQGGNVANGVEPGRYRASWYNPRTGRHTPLPDAIFPGWSCPTAPDTGDWVLHLERA